MPDEVPASAAADAAASSALADRLLGLLGDVAQQLAALQQTLAPINTITRFVASGESSGGQTPVAAMLGALAAAEPTDSVTAGEISDSPRATTMADTTPTGSVAPLPFGPNEQEMPRKRGGSARSRETGDSASDAVPPVARVLADAVGRLVELQGSRETAPPNVSPPLRNALSALAEAAPAIERLTTIVTAPRDSLLMRLAQTDQNTAAESAAPTKSSAVATRSRPRRRRTAIPPLDLPPPDGSAKPVEPSAAERMLRELTTGQEAIKKSIDELRRRPTTWMH